MSDESDMLLIAGGIGLAGLAMYLAYQSSQGGAAGATSTSSSAGTSPAAPIVPTFDPSAYGITAATSAAVTPDTLTAIDQVGLADGSIGVTTPADMSSSSTNSVQAPAAVQSVDNAGVSLVEQFEGLRLQAYPDGNGYAIGYGHHILPNENFGSSISQQTAVQLLQNDLAAVAQVINSSVLVPLTQQQFDALASLVYNIGSSNFQSSTLLQTLNSGDYAGAAQHFGDWVYSGGVVSQGLVNRRQAEAQLFNSGTMVSS